MPLNYHSPANRLQYGILSMLLSQLTMQVYSNADINPPSPEWVIFSCRVLVHRQVHGLIYKWNQKSRKHCIPKYKSMHLVAWLYVKTYRKPGRTQYAKHWNSSVICVSALPKCTAFRITIKITLTYPVTDRWTGGPFWFYLHVLTQTCTKEFPYHHNWISSSEAHVKVNATYKQPLPCSLQISLPCPATVWYPHSTSHGSGSIVKAILGNWRKTNIFVLSVLPTSLPLTLHLWTWQLVSFASGKWFTV